MSWQYIRTNANPPQLENEIKAVFPKPVSCYLSGDSDATIISGCELEQTDIDLIMGVIDAHVPDWAARDASMREALLRTEMQAAYDHWDSLTQDQINAAAKGLIGAWLMVGT